MKPVRIDRLCNKKRFWQQVEIVSSDMGGGCAERGLITLDGRMVVAPSGAPLSCPAQALAKAICTEWGAVEGECVLEDMPLTRLLVTAVEAESDPAFFQCLVDDMMSHVHDDVLFYRVAHPADLVRRQDEVWTPLLDWVHKTLGVPCRVTASVMPIHQNDAYVDAIKTMLHRMTAFDFSAFQAVARGCQSLIMGLGVIMGHLTPDLAFEAAFLDELYQNDRWGADTIAMKRRALVQADLTNAMHFAFLARNRRVCGEEASGEDVYSCEEAPS